MRKRELTSVIPPEWHKLSDGEWENDSKRKVVWDHEAQTLSTEQGLPNKSLWAVTIPFALLVTLLKDNGFDVFLTEDVDRWHEVMAQQADVYRQDLEKLEEDFREVRKDLADKRKENQSLAFMRNAMENAYGKALKLIDGDTKLLHAKIHELEAKDRQIGKLLNSRNELIEAAQREITRLRDKLEKAEKQLKVVRSVANTPNDANFTRDDALHMISTTVEEV